MTTTLQPTVVVVGLGYVGLSMACLFARSHVVAGVDIDPAKADLIRAGHSPLKDPLIEQQLAEGPAPAVVTTSLDEVPAAAVEWVIVAAPTDYDPERSYFNTSAVDAVVADGLRRFPEATFVIKSTIPVGYVEGLRARHHTDRIFHSPEFLREGRALEDNLYPGRIVVGDRTARGQRFGQILADLAHNTPPVILTDPTSAEAAKLFANTYLAMRVSFFNELDTFAVERGLEFAQLRDVVCADDRIGHGYNEPSFGYGGYCLPKDTKQLLANVHDIPQTLIDATIRSNDTRKIFIVDRIMATGPSTVGVLGLAMKRGSDNFREAAIRDVAHLLAERGITVLIHEPGLDAEEFDGLAVVNDLDEFDHRCDLVIADRARPELDGLATPVFSRDPRWVEAQQG